MPGAKKGAAGKAMPSAAGPPAPAADRGRLSLYLCGLAVTVAISLLFLYRPALVEYMDGRCYDTLIAEDGPSKWQPGPVVVAIDDQSLKRFGRWPWPRALVARLLAGIASQHPAAVGIDAIFAEPEREEPGEAERGQAAQGGAEPKAAKRVGVERGGDLLAASPGDRALAKALAAAPFVLGYELTFAGDAQAPPRQPVPSGLEIISMHRPGENDPRQSLWQATGVVGSLPQFTSGAAGSGFLNASEQEGIMRRMPALIDLNGRIYPSLALSTVLNASGIHHAVLESTWYGDSLLNAGGRGIPLDGRGRLLLRYRGWQAIEKPIPAVELLEGRLPASALTGRVVFVGATATGMGEAVATPVQALLSGVQIHAIAAGNMLAGDFARTAPWPYQLLAVALLGALATLVGARMHVTRGALFVIVAAVIGSWEGSVLLLREYGLFLSPALPLCALLANFSLLPSMRALLLERSSRHHVRELAKNRDFIVKSLASLTEIRDMETGAHILRTERYLLVLCRELSRHPKFRPLLDERMIRMISDLAPLHDIGKVGLPDQLLHKAAGFTDEEYAEVRKHTIYGRDVIVKAERRAGLQDDELLSFAKDMAYSHHERWDGSGYPEGLRGEEIPWVGRVMAVADAYDAIISRRVYKAPVSHEEAVGIIVAGKGTLFDPEIVDAFLKVEEQWRRIAAENADPAVEEESGAGSAAVK